jgi:NAD(P)-dependent dehydrogenase (short-subunit alcohol dehydrogenase family)
MNSATDLAGQVAVITGAASGIGFGLARKAAALGMRVVLADVEDTALDRAAALLEGQGHDVAAVKTDVSSESSVRQLAERAGDAWGSPPWLVVNNAGVGVPSRFLDSRPEDARWTIEVNLIGVLNGMHAFLPGLVARDAGHLVNTASMAGLLVAPGGSAYAATKHAIIALTEVVYRELAERGSNVGISCLCPGLVNSSLSTSVRNRPAHYGGAPAGLAAPGGEDPTEAGEGALPTAITPGQVADQVFEAVRQRRFWILTHQDIYAERIRRRADQIASQVNPDQESVDHVAATFL